MNEERTALYLALIRKLLACKSGEEAAIFQANQDLLDEELVLTMEWGAQQLQENGQKSNAWVLMNLAKRLAAWLRIGGSEYPEQENKVLQNYAEFITALIQAEWEGGQQSVFPILKANQNLLDLTFAEVLEPLTNSTINELPELKDNIVGVVVNIIVRIAKFPLGNYANNQEIAIAGYKFVLQHYPEGTQPWAKVKNNLAIAYFDRIQGNRADNLEEAIKCCTQALTVYTQHEFPEDWAGTQNILASVYKNRIRGERADNLEKAINFCTQALTVRTREAFPEYWAATQDNLANSYHKRIRGDSAENLEAAIKHHTQALVVYTYEAFPEKWAETQHNLANTYTDRIWGDRAENLEVAIKHHTQALVVYTCEDFPREWATIQNGLAAVYNNRVRGEKAANLEEAITLYTQALAVRNRAAFPEDWAATQHNLAAAYSYRIRGERAENLELAINYYKQALEVRTLEAFPEKWAATKNNLANTYCDRIRGDRAENLEAAIYHYTQALIIRSREAFPEDWAATQNNLGDALQEANRKQEAITCFHNTLTFWTPETNPIGCLTVTNNLGKLQFKIGNWQAASTAYETATQAIEISRGWATNEERRQEILKDGFSVYAILIQCYINLGQLHQAIETIDRSRSRRLVDLMASNDAYKGGDIPPEMQTYLSQYEDIQARVNQLRIRYGAARAGEGITAGAGEGRLIGRGTNRSPKERTEIRDEILELEQEKHQVWLEMRKFDPVLAGELQVDRLSFDQIQGLVKDHHTAILSFYITTNNTYIFIIKQTGEPELHTCTGLGYQSIREILWDGWLARYYKSKDTWQGTITETLETLAEKLQLSQLLKQLQGIQELVIIPHLFLHFIPFAALPLQASSQSPTENLDNTRGSKFKGKVTRGSMTIADKYLGDEFTLRYIPSCQILNYCQARPLIEKIIHGTIEDADGSLPGAAYEGEVIARMYRIPEANRLRGKTQATTRNYQNLAKNVQLLHSSHHASSNLTSPLESQLLLGDGVITLGQLMSPGFRLPNLDEVFLSACETSLGFGGLTDDPLTLSTGFLCAGARGVISTLWAVSDMATAVFSQLYYTQRQQGSSRPQAVQEAQKQLREMTGADLTRDYLPGMLATLQGYINQETDKKEREKLESSRQFIQSLGKKEKPFVSPYYWGAFTAAGMK